MIVSSAKVPQVETVLMKGLRNSLGVCEVGWPLIFQSIDNSWNSFVEKVFGHFLQKLFLLWSVIVFDELDFSTNIDVDFGYL